MPKDTKTALIDFAEHAARARGFDGFSYADMADAVGIRKASIHYHFPTKAELSSALMARYHREMEQSCARIDAANSTASDRLKALISLYRVALNNGQTMCLCVSFIASRESLSNDVLRQIDSFRAMMIAWARSVFELALQDGSIANTGDPKSEAHAALAVLEGAHLAARAEENVGKFDLATKLLLSRCR